LDIVNKLGYISTMILEAPKNVYEILSVGKGEKKS
jgi:hypothetical protein